MIPNQDSRFYCLSFRKRTMSQEHIEQQQQELIGLLAQLDSARSKVIAMISANKAITTPPKPVSKLPEISKSVPEPILPAIVKPPVSLWQPSISQLFNEHSPLLSLFASAEYLPFGKGRVDINTPDFKWRRDIVIDNITAATSPSGFYGKDKPECVILRLNNFILLWNFQLSPEGAKVFIAGVSDQDAEPIWYDCSKIPATPAKNLLDEVTLFVNNYKYPQPA